MGEKKITQLELVLMHLERFGTITSFEAFVDYGITRLSAIIYTLRKLGYKIENKMLTTKNRLGNYTSYAKYTLSK